MAPATQTLLEYLVSPNPQVNSQHSWTGANTKSTGNMWGGFERLDPWDDFSFETLHEIYGDLLLRDFDQGDLPDFNKTLPYHLTEIRNEDTLETLLIRWNNAVVSAALAVSQKAPLKTSAFQNERCSEIFMARGGQASLKPRSELNHNTKKMPDWAGIKKEDVHLVDVSGRARMMHMNLLPGDTKLSTKWKSEKISLHRNNAEVKAPIQQILTYCVHAQVRYGYLLTQDELVVFRVSEISKPSQITERKKRSAPPQDQSIGSSKYIWNLKYKAIPWETNSGGNSPSLTINLALWWLHMLAAQRRSLQPGYSDLRTEYLPLTPIIDSASSSFTTSGKRSRQDEEDSFTMEPGRKTKKRGDVGIQGPAMSFESQVSV
jgi:hypothetical protein